MKVPTRPLSLMRHVYQDIMPVVHRELDYWQERAAEIPNEELRNQALASIDDKAFHCEGGSIMALAALQHKDTAIRFIVAYQTISDYLDNLCDRSTSLDPFDFAALHESMKDAITIDAKPQNYYRFRNDQDDGGYLVELMQTCQHALLVVVNYKMIVPYINTLCNHYCELQIHKHVNIEERENRLKKWFTDNKTMLPTMEWYEFSACAGSTLGIFSLVSYALRDDFKSIHAAQIYNGYFPYIQGLHILLDYFIDQEEDKEENDLNFCFYYENENELCSRLIYFLKQADNHTKELPNMKFHQLINRGLLGIYLSEQKVHHQADLKLVAKKLLKEGGGYSQFFYWNGKAYRWIKKKKQKHFKK